MPTDQSPPPPPPTPSAHARRKASRTTDSRRLFNFVEELSWLLTSYDGTDFKALANLSKEFQHAVELRNSLAHRTGAGGDDALVGVLPGLLVDERLFPSNEDIAEFASTLLSIEIPRWSKKSKYELIGHIVCHAHLAPPSRRRKLAEAMRSLVVDRDIVTKRIATDRQAGASWNEIIQSLV